MAEILGIAKGGTLKTAIMCKANLSFTQLNDYIEFILNNNLITKTNNEGKEVYFITEKDLDFLRRHSELTRLLKTCNGAKKGRFPSPSLLKKT